MYLGRASRNSRIVQCQLAMLPALRPDMRYDCSTNVECQRGEDRDPHQAPEAERVDHEPCKSKRHAVSAQAGRPGICRQGHDLSGAVVLCILWYQSARTLRGLTITDIPVDDEFNQRRRGESLQLNLT